MKQVLILGSGAGGTMVANNLRKKLSPKQWDITIIDNDEIHHYQPGWLFIPFDVYSPEVLLKKAAPWMAKRKNTAMII